MNTTQIQYVKNINANKPNYSILSKDKILQEYNNKNIFIYDFNVNQLNTCSYDIVLGKYYYREQNSVLKKGITTRIFNQYDKDEVIKKWGSYSKSVSVQTIKEIYKIPLNGICNDEEIILIHPGETLLCHSQEFIGGVKNITTMLKGKSSMRRSNITICDDAGWGDIGYCNRWTLEITNKSKYYSTVLVVGRPIGQIIFMKTDDCDECYTQNGKYQNTKDVFSMIKKWKPTDMLPKSYLTKK